MAGFDFGAALTAFGQAAPGIGKSFDDAKRQREQDEIEKRKTEAYLRQLAIEGKATQQGLSDKKYAAERTKTLDTETDTKKTEARRAYDSWKDMETKASGQFVGPLQETEATKVEQYKLKPSLDRMKEMQLPYHAASDEGIEKTLKAETDKEKERTGLFAGWKKKIEERDAINAMPDGPEKDAAWDQWEKTWATSTYLSASDPYISKAVKKAKEVQIAQIPGKTIEAGAVGKAGVIGKVEGETEANIGALPGFKAIPGVRITDESIGKVKGLSPDIESMIKMTDDLITKYDKMGMRFVGNEAADYMSKVRNLQLLAKSPSLYNLGVLTGPDLMLLEQAIPNPSSIKEGAKKQVLGDLSVKLNNFKDLLKMRGDQFYRINGFEKEKPTSGGSGSKSSASTDDDIINRYK